MGSDRVRVERKSSSTLIPGYKPKQFSFLQPRYQDQVDTETVSVQENKQQNSSDQANPVPPFLGHSFGRVSVLPIQTKLAIGQPNDKYEQEADRVADEVMRMPEPSIQRQIEPSSHLPKSSVFSSFASMAKPVSNGSLEKPEEPLGEFNEEGQEGAVSTEEEAETVASETETTLDGETPSVAQPAPVPTAPQPEPAASVTRTVIRGPREMWHFDGETPPNYAVSSRLSTNRTGGTFRWSVSPQLTLSSPTDATPTVTTTTPSAPPGRDAWVRVRHTDTSGLRTVASYRLTILAPASLTHLSNVDNVDATWGYLTEIHYSIHDQLGTILPRNVPINEQWTGPVVADFAGMNWPRGPEGAANVNPANWHDRVGGVGAGGVPAPVGPGHADAGVAICHWPGDWRVGSLTIGSGRRVSSVTWQRNRGFARHR